MTELEEIFNPLPPIPTPTFMLGSWKGGSLDTGHPGHKMAGEVRWAGKEFRSVDDGDPMYLYNDDGDRVFAPEYGHSCLREMVYRGVTSTAMVYDDKPVFDHFRFVDQDMVMGAMDAPKMGLVVGVYFFFLTRRKG